MVPNCAAAARDGTICTYRHGKISTQYCKVKEIRFQNTTCLGTISHTQIQERMFWLFLEGGDQDFFFFSL